MKSSNCKWYIETALLRNILRFKNLDYNSGLLKNILLGGDNKVFNGILLKRNSF